MNILNRIVPVSVKTTAKRLPVIKPWYERKKLRERYDDVMSEVYDPQLHAKG